MIPVPTGVVMMPPIASAFTGTAQFASANRGMIRTDEMGCSVWIRSSSSVTFMPGSMACAWLPSGAETPAGIAIAEMTPGRCRVDATLEQREHSRRPIAP